MPLIDVSTIEVISIPRPVIEGIMELIVREQVQATLFRVIRCMVGYDV